MDAYNISLKEEKKLLNKIADYFMASFYAVCGRANKEPKTTLH